jgi:hypothetical protein
VRPRHRLLFRRRWFAFKWLSNTNNDATPQIRKEPSCQTHAQLKYTFISGPNGEITYSRIYVYFIFISAAQGWRGHLLDVRANLVANLLRPDQDLVTAKIACALSARKAISWRFRTGPQMRNRVRAQRLSWAQFALQSDCVCANSASRSACVKIENNAFSELVTVLDEVKIMVILVARPKILIVV